MPLQKKVALLGAPGVGKTSLVRRFVESMFDETYLTTIGVKVDKKLVTIGATDVQMMLWDVAGAEENFSVPMSYVRGSAGFLLVVDGTRPETLERGLDLVVEVDRALGPLPHILVLNKIDLTDTWRLDDAALAPAERPGRPIVRASAKTGEGVEAAFLELAQRLIG
jgi:small GTP-binding protein